MRIFSDFDVYEYKYNYEEMKIMSLLTEYEDARNLDYEDLCCIAEAVYAHWSNDDERSEEKIQRCPWLEFETDEEDHYIQAYAQRVLPEFVQLYKENYLY